MVWRICQEGHWFQVLTFSPSLVVVCASSTCIMNNNNKSKHTLDQEEKYSEDWTYIFNLILDGESMWFIGPRRKLLWTFGTLETRINWDYPGKTSFRGLVNLLKLSKYCIFVLLCAFRDQWRISRTFYNFSKGSVSKDRLKTPCLSYSVAKKRRNVATPVKVTQEIWRGRGRGIFCEVQ